MKLPLTRLKHLAAIRVSTVDKKTAEGQIPVRLINYTDVYYHDRLSPEMELMSASASAAQVAAFRLHEGDVVITKDSETADDIGVPSYVARAAEDMVCGYHLAVLRPHASAVHGRFLYWSMVSDPAREQLAATATGVTRFGLRLDAIGSVELFAPPVTVQRAIADFLDAETARIDTLIAKKRRMIERLTERRKSVVAAGVAGLLTSFGSRRASTLTWLDSLPDHWDEVGLTLVARLGSGHTPSRSRDDWWIESECVIPWITTGEVARLRDDRVEYIEGTRERISPTGLENSAAEVHPANTVVLSRTASAGYSGIMRYDMTTSQDFATWTCGPLLRPRFLLLCLRAMRGDLLGRLGMGSTHQTIYMPDIQSLRIPLPSLDEQDEVVDAVWERLTPSGDCEDSLTRQIDLLAERRQALITAAVTGELSL